MRSVAGSSLIGFLFVLALLAAGLAFFFLRGGAPASPSPSAEPGATPVPAGALEVVFAYGSEKQAWVEAVTARFNAGQPALPSGKRFVVSARAMGSGECIDDVAAGRCQAHLVSPASDAFIKLGNAKARAANGKDLIGRCDNLVLSPVVVAMWKPMAEALGWGRKPVGWADLLPLVGDGRGWGGLGQPQWGAFRFGHTHPAYSNSGLQTLFALVYAGAGKTAGLTLQDTAEAKVQAFVAGIERGVVHYGQSTGFFAKRLAANGPGYLSAAVLYESSVIEANAKPGLAFPLVAVYPKEGTFWSDHPCGVVEREWVTTDHRAAAERYLKFLLEKPQQEQALQFGFRPADPAIALAAPIVAANGVDPQEPRTTLETPSTEVMDACLRLWQQAKKRAEVVLVFDRSGSMNEGGKIAAARTGAEQLVSLLGDEDVFGLLPFNAQLQGDGSGLALKGSRQQALGQVRTLFADGGTALYDAIDKAYASLAARAGDGRIAAIVVLTDGADTNSRLPLDQLLAHLAAKHEGGGIRVFTIGYGKDANKEVLKRIADATQAAFYAGTTDNIITVFRDISTFF
jgi:Ca-activated chloride channel family protein